MVSIQKQGGNYNGGILDIVGLSTDTKPNNSSNPLKSGSSAVHIENGSVYFEMDTSLVFVFDEENDVWYGF